MRTLIILIATATTLLFTACQRECQEPVFDQFGNFSHMADVDCNRIEQNNVSCDTDFMLGQPESESIRAIQVDTQGYPNGNGTCVFDLSLYEAGLPLTPTNVEWTLNGQTFTIGQTFITMQIPTEYMLLCVNYNVGNQIATSCRSFE